MSARAWSDHRSEPLLTDELLAPSGAVAYNASSSHSHRYQDEALDEAIGQGAVAVSSDRSKRETMSIEEATISNMWEIAALVEVLERKGLCTKQDLVDIIVELRKKNPRANIPEPAFPEPYLLTETENKIIDDILELLDKNGLTAHHSLNLLERLGSIIEMGQRLPTETKETIH